MLLQELIRIVIGPVLRVIYVKDHQPALGGPAPLIKLLEPGV
jgi:hypothetical protein